MIKEFNSWVVYAFLKFCEIRIWNLKFKIRSSIHIVYFSISYKQMSVIYYVSSSVICQMKNPQPLPKRFLHLTRFRASSFKWEYPLEEKW
jgi:ribonuclease HIII